MCCTYLQNWGNWNAAAGVHGGRINRFNILKQSKDYDLEVPDVFNAYAYFMYVTQM
jgi:hypothetical protein